MQNQNKNKQIPVRECDKNLLSALSLAEEMLTLADKGDFDRNDDSCGVLYAFMRDAAYRIFKMARDEKKSHISSGKWHYKNVVSQGNDNLEKNGKY